MDSVGARTGELLSEAVAHHRAGRAAAAEQGYRAVLERDAQHPSAWHQLGLLAHQQGDAELAERRIRTAIATEPDVALYHSNLGLTLRAQGDHAAAVACFERALALDPGLVQAHFMLGVAALGRQELDTAVLRFQRAVELAPEFREASFNLGVALGRQGDARGAIASYRRALEVDPGYVKAWTNLANALHSRREYDDALAAYRELLERDPASADARHMIAALTGERTGEAPAEYVARVFDDCAARYEQQLVESLRYITPRELARLIEAQVAPAPGHFHHALDIGCGTGLAGREIRPWCRRLVGIDLSPNMVTAAERTTIYDQLEVAEATAYLQAQPVRFDLVVAADVLIYVGDLTACFAAVAKACVAGGLFALSTERGAGGDYELSRSGRYTHRRRYVERLAAEHGFVLRTFARRALRLEHEEPVPGQLFLLERAKQAS